MTVFSKDFDWRRGETITAFKAGTEVPAKVLDEARAAGVVKEKAGEGAAARGTSGASDAA